MKEDEQKCVVDIVLIFTLIEYLRLLSDLYTYVFNKYNRPTAVAV